MRKSLSLTVAFGVAVALLTAPSAGAATKISNGTACTKLGASITVASDVMLIGLIQVVKELQDEVRDLKATHGIKE